MNEKTKKEIKEIEVSIDFLGNKIYSFRKIRYLIKFTGIISMFVTIFLKQWFYVFILWLLFFPDSEDIIGFLKN